jgi:alcohol dehydrogenase class IV
MLPSVLRYKRDVKGQQERRQKQVLQAFNEVLGWDENSAADAVARFVQSLELPGSLSAVGVEDEGCLDKVAELTMTDVWGGSKRQIETKEEVLEILHMARM